MNKSIKQNNAEETILDKCHFTLDSRRHLKHLNDDKCQSSSPKPFMTNLVKTTFDSRKNTNSFNEFVPQIGDFFRIWILGHVSNDALIRAQILERIFKGKTQKQRRHNKDTAHQTNPGELENLLFEDQEPRPKELAKETRTQEPQKEKLLKTNVLKTKKDLYRKKLQCGHDRMKQRTSFFRYIRNQ